MSVNWVMFAQGTSDFIRLPGESILFTTPARVAFSLDSVNKYPGKKPYQLSSPSGKAWLTNKRLIYLPAVQPPSTSNNPSPLSLHSFSAPHTQIHDSHVTAPWFGPNAWSCLIQPVPGGGIPTSEFSVVELTLTFREGGAYDFHTRICEIKERLAQMRELYGVAEEVGSGGVHLDQLPAYEEVGRVGNSAAPAVAETGNVMGMSDDEPPYVAQMQLPRIADAGPTLPMRRSPQIAVLPDEPPPGYDEVAGGRLVSEFEGTAVSMNDGRTVQEGAGRP